MSCASFMDAHWSLSTLQVIDILQAGTGYAHAELLVNQPRLQIVSTALLYASPQGVPLSMQMQRDDV